MTTEDKYAAIGVAVMLLLIFVGSTSEDWLPMLSWDYWLYDGGTKSTRSEVLRNIGLLVLAIFGLGFAVYRSVVAHMQATAA